MREPAISVVGPVTGRQYLFSGWAAVQRVAVQDAPSLLRTAMFATVRD
jgi:hypothetical protein